MNADQVMKTTAIKRLQVFHSPFRLKPTNSRRKKAGIWLKISVKLRWADLSISLYSLQREMRVEGDQESVLLSVRPGEWEDH